MPDPEDAVKHANGAINGEEHSAPQLRRSAFRAMVQDFSPIWFTWCMNSGALAQLIHQCPYRFNGIDVLADIFFVINLVLFITASMLYIGRLVWFRPHAYNEIINDMAELTFTSCWPISFMTLTSNVALIASTAWWGGHQFTMVSYAMWWIVQTWNLCFLLWCFTTIIRRHDDKRLPMSIIIPAVSVSTIGITGAVVTTFARDMSAKLAVPVMILSFNWTGMGILFGMILSTYLFHGLLTKGWPVSDQSATMFILVGPMGQSAAALQILGYGANTIGRFEHYNAGTFITAESAKGLDAACVLLALLMNGLAVAWASFGVFCMLERAWRRELRWTPAWNAIIFPNATMTTSFLIFADEMDSPAYRTITVILILILTVIYFVNLAFTILRVWQGKLLIVREDWRVRQQIDQQKQE